jgi:hypothetical protein
MPCTKGMLTAHSDSSWVLPRSDGFATIGTPGELGLFPSWNMLVAGIRSFPFISRHGKQRGW